MYVNTSVANFAAYSISQIQTILLCWCHSQCLGFSHLKNTVVDMDYMHYIVLYYICMLQFLFF